MIKKIIHYMLSIILLLTGGCATSQRDITRRFFRNEIPGDIKELFFGHKKTEKIGGICYSLYFIDCLPFSLPWFNNTERIGELQIVSYPQLKKIYDNVWDFDYLPDHAYICRRNSYFSPVLLEGIVIIKTDNSADGFLSMNAYISRYLFDKRLSPDSIIFYVNDKYVKGKEVDRLIGLKKRDLKGFSLDFDSVSKTLNIFVRTKK